VGQLKKLLHGTLLVTIGAEFRGPLLHDSQPSVTELDHVSPLLGALVSCPQGKSQLLLEHFRLLGRLRMPEEGFQADC